MLELSTGDDLVSAAAHLQLGLAAGCVWGAVPASSWHRKSFHLQRSIVAPHRRPTAAASAGGVVEGAVREHASRLCVSDCWGAVCQMCLALPQLPPNSAEWEELLAEGIHLQVNKEAELSAQPTMTFYPFNGDEARGRGGT